LRVELKKKLKKNGLNWFNLAETKTKGSSRMSFKEIAKLENQLRS
jgi:hypothetical protein